MLTPGLLLLLLLLYQASGLEKLQGLSLGPRLLLALAAAMEELGGVGAAARLAVVLHVDEGQESHVCRDLATHHHWG